MQSALVIDTNFVMHNKPLLEDLKTLSPEYGHKLVIPWTVIQELDHLKSPHLDKLDQKQRLVRGAISWVYDQLANLDHRVSAQGIDDVMQKGLRGDDAILDCCRWLQKMKGFFTVLLSNDKNLCNKAIIHGIPTVTYRSGMTAKSIAEKVREECSKCSTDRVVSLSSTSGIEVDFSDMESEGYANSGTTAGTDMLEDVTMDSIDSDDDYAEPAQTKHLSNIVYSTSKEAVARLQHLESSKHNYDIDQSSRQSSQNRSRSKSKSRSPEVAVDPETQLRQLKSRVEDRLKQAYGSLDLQYLYKEPTDYQTLFRVLQLFRVSVFRGLTGNDFTEMRQRLNEPQDPIWRTVYGKI